MKNLHYQKAMHDFYIASAAPSAAFDLDDLMSGLQALISGAAEDYPGPTGRDLFTVAIRNAATSFSIDDDQIKLRRLNLCLQQFTGAMKQISDARRG